MGKFISIQDAATKILSSGKFKALTTANGWKKGDVVNISNAYVSHPYVQVVLLTGTAYNLTLGQCESVVETKAELSEEIQKLEKSIELVKAKLKYLESTNQETFDETEFKVWNTLQLLKGKKNDVEKAKAIAGLING